MAKQKKAAKPKKTAKPKKAARPKKIARQEKAPKLKKMVKSELKKYKELLIKEREKVGGDLSHIAQDTLNKSQRDASGDLSGYAYHMADMASDDYERDFSLGRATEEQKMLYTIDEALKRIEDQTYGSCVQCSKQISKKRLQALPFTALCINCQKENEGK